MMYFYEISILASTVDKFDTQLTMLTTLSLQI